MSCTDCGGGVPTRWWKRCERCAYEVLRVLLSGGRATARTTARRWARGDRVRVIIDSCAEADALPGKVVRVRDDGYTIDLDRGGRCYVGSLLLRDPVVEPGQHAP